MSNVIIAKQPGAIDLIFNALRLENILANKKNIFIKVNLRAAAVKNYTPGAITSLPVVEELTKKLVNIGKKIIIAEGTSSKIMTNKAIENSGIEKLSSASIQIINLNTVKTRRINLPNSKLKYIEVYLPVFDADYIISLSVMKTHTATLVSAAMKNMMGITSESTLPRLHLRGVDESIANLNLAIKPHLSIVDATIAMEGTGPVLGSAVKLDRLVAGFDPVTVDSACARMMGFNPGEVKHLVIGEKIGIGKISPDMIIGELTVKNFKRPDHSLVKDMYSLQWFNWLMSKKIIHKLVYDYFYFIIKKLLNLVRHKDR